jgi:hypothetical protein
MVSSPSYWLLFCEFFPLIGLLMFAYVLVPGILHNKNTTSYVMINVITKGVYFAESLQNEASTPGFELMIMCTLEAKGMTIICF